MSLPLSFTRVCAAGFTLLLAAATLAAAAEPTAQIAVTLPRSGPGPYSGRVIVTFEPAAEGAEDPWWQEGAAGFEVSGIPGGATVTFPADASKYPADLSALPPGRYVARAMLDVMHRVAYSGEPYGGFISSPQQIVVKAGTSLDLHFALDRAVAERTDPDTKSVRHVSFVSPALSGFWQRPIAMHAVVLLPPDYARQPERRFPTIFTIDGFGADAHVGMRQLARWQKALAANGAQLIVVFLDPSFPSGHHVFADSANNGPWGRALTAEFIPELEREFRMSATPRTRLLNGHSSGGWSSLWLQITYPEVFGGTWSSSPDPVDFHDFTGPDLTHVPANVYHDAAGREFPLVRDPAGKDVMTVRQYVEHEEAEGPTGGQWSSFDAVFSPRRPDGTPAPLFDRASGAVDPVVAAYWEAHYDIAALLRARWPELGPQLRGKLNIFVGTQDTYHLEGAVYRLRDELRDLGSDAQITIVPGADHGTIFRWKGGLIEEIVRQMLASLPPEFRTSGA
ncbi:MAG TPA: alpha/beta hydrolase-fold protein [Candidatus Baltobacteraceae bacterium]|nr:alpha/beta hydrolase-fold protein [Candidatus Baltobacteraceae bacterium]